jgi:hypothetical protein
MLSEKMLPDNIMLSDFYICLLAFSL